MSYAVRTDGVYGWRAVNGPEDCLPNETWQAEQPAPYVDIKQILIDAVQKHLDEAAKERGYDDIKSAVTYADEPSVLQFQQEGQAYRAWRSLTWAKCYEIMAQVQEGQRPVPTLEELFEELPVPNLP